MTLYFWENPIASTDYGVLPCADTAFTYLKFTVTVFQSCVNPRTS